MYVLHKVAHETALRALAMLVVVTLLLWAAGVSPFSQKVDAANVTFYSDTLSDSDISARSNHTVRFIIPNGMLASQTFTLTFPAAGGEFSLANMPSAGLDFGDIDLMDDAVEQTLGASNGAAQWGIATTSSTIQFTAPSGGPVSSSSALIIEIGTHATSGATGDFQIMNPTSAASYRISVAGSMVDSGHTMVAILDNVLVTADVQTSFDFDVFGQATSSNVNGTSTTRTSTPTTIPFGTLTAGVIQTLAQHLTVSTNAAQGFAVTVYQDTNLLSSTGADIDGFSNGAYTDIPGAWADPTNSITDEKTWGHWGITTEDDIVAGGGAFGSNQWVAASTTPRGIFSHGGPADGLTADTGSTTVGFQVEITNLQEAGDDYTTTLTYIATPVF